MKQMIYRGPCACTVANKFSPTLYTYIVWFLFSVSTIKQPLESRVFILFIDGCTIIQCSICNGFFPKEVLAPRKPLEPFYAKPNPSSHITLLHRSSLLESESPKGYSTHMSSPKGTANRPD